MVMRSIACVLSVLVLAACQTVVPLTATPSFITSPGLLSRNPADIAVLPVEDGTPAGDARLLLEYMRQSLEHHLPERRYSPIASRVVDAKLKDLRPERGETTLTPVFLKRVAGRATEDALLAVRVGRWDESRLMSEKRVEFEFQATLVGNDGEVFWSGSLVGNVKSGGLSAAPRDRTMMTQSCADLAIAELLNHLALRHP
jgi:hypothetical protein